ncbi:MAG: hypothetical protein ACRDRS_07525 [Pseudonocardiaceae bacterium]
MREIERAAQVVRFWRTVEIFSPQSAPKNTQHRKDADPIVLDLAPDELALGSPVIG